MRVLSGALARAQRVIQPGRRQLMAEELRISFPGIRWTERTMANVVRSADDLQMQCLAEELVLGRLNAENVARFTRFDGREHLDAALARGKGVVLTFPHAGAIMLLIALVSLAGYDFTQVAARGFPPKERQRLRDVTPSRWNVAVRNARERAEDKLPAHFHGMDDNPRALFRALERNGIVAVAFDGRGGSRFRPTPFLGRTALLSTGPWRLAASTGAAIVPAFCLRDRDRSHRLLLRPALIPSDQPLQERCLDLQTRFLAEIEPILERHPDHYARWLLHCRTHAGLDDHPLFVDTAADEGWKRHAGARF